MTKSVVSFLGVGLALGLIGGCGGDDPAATAPASAPGGARTLEIPGTAGGNVPGGDGSHANSPELMWDVPAGWIEEQPSSSMRYAQYRVEGSGGAGSCLVFYFGPGQGGDPLANARRWANQFKQPDGSASTDAMKITELTSTQLPTQVVEVAGTYAGGMSMTDAPAPEMPGYMLLGAIVQGPDAPWFFKFTGPESTVQAERETFLEMVASIRGHG